METLLFIPLGTREIKLKNLNYIKDKITNEDWKKLIEEIKYPEDNKDFRKLNVRELGKWVDNYFEVIKDNIDIQIIEPFLKWLKEQNKNISKIYLIATNQKEETDQEQRNRDSCIIAKFLKDTFFPFYFQIKGYNKSPEVEIIELNNKPNDYDLMIREIDENLKCKLHKNIDNNQYVVYAEITGGTPQINTALMLNCIKYFKKRAKFIYKSETETTVKSLEIGNFIIKNYEDEALQRLAERYDFDAISKNENYLEIIRKLAECACYRMNFDFYNYKRCMTEVNQSYQELSSYRDIKCLQEDAFNLIQKNKPEAVFNEIYWNAVIMWERDECANFIGRVWRIKEAVIQYSLIDIINCPWDDITENFKKKFQKWARGNEDFIEYLKINKDKYGIKDRINKKNIIPTSPILNACIDFLAQRDSTNHKSNINFIVLSETNKKLKEFSDMRNNSIIAHGFKYISKQKIKDSIKNDDIFNILQELIGSIGIQISNTNPYTIFKDIIVEINQKDLENI